MTGAEHETSPAGPSLPEPDLWRVGDPALVGTPHLRFISRKDKGSGLSWMIGVLMDLSGALVVSAPVTRTERDLVLGICVEKILKTLHDSRYSGQVELSVRAKGFREDEISAPHGISLLRLDPDEMSPLTPSSVDEILTSLLIKESETARAARLTMWHKRSCLSPQMLIRPINDLLPVREEVKAPPPPAAVRPPVTSVIGLAGVGKSSLISGLLGLAGEDLPPTSTSRTTLCPIAFRNDPSAQLFRLEVSLRSEKEQVRKVSDRLAAAVEIALERSGPVEDLFSPRSPEAEALMRSPDGLFDLRFTLGKFSAENENWADLLTPLRELLGFLKAEGVSADEVHEYGLTDPVARALWESVRTRVRGLSFGEVTSEPDGGLTFRYASRNRKGVIEAGRRFYAVGMRYAGKSFGPFCRRVTMSGPWVAAQPFELVDNRGFDHEGALEAVAGSDLLDEIALSDRVLIVESAEKVGDRQTMALVSRLISGGEGDKLLFAHTRADLPLSRGADLEGHVEAGLLNGLNALDEAVGHNAVQGVRERILKHPPLLFGHLDQAYELGDRGLLCAERNEETDLDNAEEAGRLFRLLSAKPDDVEEEACGRLSLAFSEKKLRAALSAAWSEAYVTCLALYGPDEKTRGTLHWGTVKAEVRALTKAAFDPEVDVRQDLMLLLAEHLRAVSAAASRVIDAPLPGETRGIADIAAIRSASNALRRQIAPLLEYAIIGRLVFSHLEDWVAARDLSMVSFGPGSTLERAARIRSILVASGTTKETSDFFKSVSAGLISSGVTLKRV